jgi:hypothetical protein
MIKYLHQYSGGVKLNKPFDTDRKPLTEVVYRFGSSRLFLFAIIFLFGGALIKFVYNVTALNFGYFGVGTGDATVREFFDYLKGTVGSLLDFGVSLIISHGLYTSYKQFKGAEVKSNGFQTVKIGIALSIALFAVSFGINVFYGNNLTSMLTEGLFLVLIVVFLILFYRSAKESMEYAENAMHNNPRGRIGGFLIFCLFAYIIAFFGNALIDLTNAVRLLSSPITEGMELERAEKVVESLVDLTSMIISIPHVFAHIFFLKLARRFRKAMNIAKEDWSEVERKNKRSGI